MSLASLYNKVGISGRGGGGQGCLMGIAADLFPRYYNITSRICMNRQRLAFQRPKRGRGTYILADDGTTEVNRVEKRKIQSTVSNEHIRMS